MIARLFFEDQYKSEGHGASSCHGLSLLDLFGIKRENPIRAIITWEWLKTRLSAALRQAKEDHSSCMIVPGE